MKYFLFFLTSCGLIFLFAGCASRKSLPDSRILSFNYVKQGTRSVPDMVRSASLMPDGRCHAHMADFEKVDSTVCGPEVMDIIYDCLKRGKIQNYKERYRPHVRIYDGYSWTVGVKFENGESISSGGYMAYPKDFSAVKDAINIIEHLFK